MLCKACVSPFLSFQKIHKLWIFFESGGQIRPMISKKCFFTLSQTRVFSSNSPDNISRNTELLSKRNQVHQVPFLTFDPSCKGIHTRVFFVETFYARQNLGPTRSGFRIIVSFLSDILHSKQGSAQSKAENLIFPEAEISKFQPSHIFCLLN